MKLLKIRTRLRKPYMNRNCDISNTSCNVAKCLGGHIVLSFIIYKGQCQGQHIIKLFSLDEVIFNGYLIYFKINEIFKLFIKNELHRETMQTLFLVNNK